MLILLMTAFAINNLNKLIEVLKHNSLLFTFSTALFLNVQEIELIVRSVLGTVSVYIAFITAFIVMIIKGLELKDKIKNKKKDNEDT